MLEQKLLQQLKKIASTYLSSQQLTLLDQAYQFAKKQHGSTKRESGEPYITHPLAVAIILAKSELGPDTLIAGLLHDTIEDSNAKPELIKEKFGPEVERLVSGVTKLARIKLRNSNPFLPQFITRRRVEQQQFERQVESLRKMLLAMTDDVRVILIKLADRLHNMQTLDAVRPDKRARIAQETLEIYVPLANRLGMGEIRGQLQDLAFPYIDPAEYGRLKEITKHRISEKEAYIKRFQRVLRAYLESEQVQVIDIHGRIKHLYSLWRKLNRYQNDLSKIYDLVALRIIVPTTKDCYQALGLIHSRWNPLLGRIKDYIATPKPNGYRSLHTTVFGLDGEIIEIQIRTQQMHEQAEHGIAAHWHYSEAKDAKQVAQRESQDKMTWLKQLKDWQKQLSSPVELKKALQLDFFSDQIFVFTPQGDVVNLPTGATPVDFAYAIHSDIGDSCVGAKVDGKIITLNTELNNGDIIEIITSNKKHRPKRDWLKFVKTHKARTRIKNKLSN